jgi:NADPH2:quinone reductase
MRAIRVSRTGGPEALEYVEVPVPKPGPGEALVKIEAIGVNYIDIYHRSGLYPLPTPFTPGSEAAGIVEETGERVVYAMNPGSYAEYAVVPEWKLVKIPDAIDARTAAAAMLQGLTAHYLTHSTHPLAKDEAALVHAAAGGAGALIVQMAKARGAFVFATASTKKLDIPRADGADVVIDYTSEDFREIVLQRTKDAGVRVVYDSVGKTTFDKSLDCVGLRGVLALFGQSSGVVPPVDPARLAKRGIYLTRPSLAHYSSTRDELLSRARDLFAMIENKTLHVRIAHELPLSEAGEAHRLLESRATAGKLLLIP